MEMKHWIGVVVVIVLAYFAWKHWGNIKSTVSGSVAPAAS